ncbi:hypothetical protein FA09DRAFT_337977 [Tilletiopsis washingtonensis]|uniref:Alanine racemase N-terminal domain-containing protein n=1 Tax=Tilletiopsis washingtonensis TaxID=58919 RepID=A0A316ZEJ5_9BASI|nr:hypothetical protein FA09DRAFT_337977 [Tilletiopsis washingtonensis]PWN98673.1 hypothetical protein FA09DRAFT_337977 [Tilletiopsis washingtonensis]
MTTPYMALPSQAALQAAYVGLPLAVLPTPSVVIDVSIMRRNAERMRRAVDRAGVRFRCHIKTHKAVEGTRVCLGAEGSAPSQHRAIIVSTLAEAWHVLPLVEEGVVDDILYGVPLPVLRIAEARRLRDTMRSSTD